MTKPILKTYVYTYHMHNTYNQEGDVVCTFKAESLDQLDDYIDLYHQGAEQLIPKGRFSTKDKTPKGFHEAGGFCGHDASFICKETGEDMRDWWQENGWGVIED